MDYDPLFRLCADGCTIPIAGVQYAARAYAGLLESNWITVSISRKAKPWDNAACL